MKIIDKTPLQDANGEISFINRIQGTLKYGMSWYNDLASQKMVIGQMNQMIEKGYVLIRNFTLPNSEIVIPIILVGVTGVYVISVTSAKGFFEARGDQWNSVTNGKAQPAPINMIGRTAQLAKVLQKYIENSKIALPAAIEPILIAADPGAHVDSIRPAARVVMSDAIRQFITSLLQGRPVLSSDKIYGIADRILDPASAAPEPVAAEKSVFDPSATGDESATGDFGFSFEDDGMSELQPSIVQTVDAIPPARRPRPAAAPKKSRILGMSTPQLLLLVGMFFVEMCVLAGFAYIILSSS